MWLVMGQRFVAVVVAMLVVVEGLGSRIPKEDDVVERQATALVGRVLGVAERGVISLCSAGCAVLLSAMERRRWNGGQGRTQAG
jgi:hypothetical protein